MDEFVFDLRTGEVLSLPFSVYRTLPVDLNGDGLHELVRGLPGGNGEVLDRHGNVIGQIGGTVSLIGKLFNLPGEQVLAFYPDGKVRLWADRNAMDSEAALARYANPFYRTNMRVMAVGYNLPVLAGL